MIIKMPREFGLIGYPLSHSFSKKYFAEKFAKEGIENAVYDNYAIDHIGILPSLFDMNPTLIGLNVTIPYKESVMDYLDELADDAREIGAVNTIKRYPNGKLKGFNSDIYGFGETLNRFIDRHEDPGVLILGTGGASKAVNYVCKSLGFQVKLVSRTGSDQVLSYEQLDAKTMQKHLLIVNTTPLGMHPKVDEYPSIPFDLLSPKHQLLDLIYNPAQTTFLTMGLERGCRVKNGLEMLILQAEKSWRIWNDPDC